MSNPRSSILTVRSDAPFKVVSLAGNGTKRDMPVPGGSATIVSMLLQSTEIEGPLDVAIGLVSGDVKTMTVDPGAASANFGDPSPTPTIAYELGAIAAGAILAWLLLADRGRK